MATKLLFRDKRSRLLLADLKTDRKISLLDYCNYVQWVPNSDVIVAQSNDQLCIWYQAENPDEVNCLFHFIFTFYLHKSFIFILLYEQ